MDAQQKQLIAAAAAQGATVQVRQDLLKINVSTFFIFFPYILFFDLFYVTCFYIRQRSNKFPLERVYKYCM